MIRLKNIAIAAALCTFASVSFAAPVKAQSARTWVSGVGDDINPCSRTAPCKTFAGAILKTNAGGEINCLDAAGYGAVTITKAITITCDGAEAGILVSGTPAITISVAGPDTVTLSGLDLVGTVSGPNGILINSGNAVIIRNTKIEGFYAVGASGIAYRSTGPTRLTLDNVTLINNYNGLSVQPVTTGGGFVSVNNSVMAGNSNAGVRFMLNNGGSVRGAIKGSSIVTNGDGVVVDTTANAGSAGVVITDSDVSLNTASGVTSTGANSGVIVGGSTISGNNVGVQASVSAVLKSFGGNSFEVNISDGAFTGNVATK
ncbi:MAG: hypothetical protein JWN66_2740 [Sphingomonas bacterium]|uniref:hypothetical protein n=1 Tax=Sphingomonas bacterium TaxID=1895847 RepID=UPI00262E249D|nr:hypothetical protein [Sphingomonas bacterium]MDB5705624.1 hypothetical protein [Sphingomonas bacterium]